MSKTWKEIIALIVLLLLVELLPEAEAVLGLGALL
jgi:hypothetical protein